MPTLEGGLGWFTEDMVKQYLSFQCFMVSISGGVGRFVPMVMVVERGMLHVQLFFSNISVLQSIPLHCIVRPSGENDSKHLWSES
jgi:hypothetical protein